MTPILSTDTAGNLYVDIENVRITYVCAAHRRPDTEWAGTDVLRIQAYREPGSRALHMGAEIILPVNGPGVLRVIEGLACLCSAAHGVAPALAA